MGATVVADRKIDGRRTGREGVIDAVALDVLQAAQHIVGVVEWNDLCVKWSRRARCWWCRD